MVTTPRCTSRTVGSAAAARDSTRVVTVVTGDADRPTGANAALAWLCHAWRVTVGTDIAGAWCR